MSTEINRTDIEKGLKNLGVKAGMALEVHSSLSSFGYVNGGAMTVIEALMQVVSNDGAIVMPSLMLSPNLPLNDTDKQLGLSCKIKILQDNDEKSAMGIISDTFRKMPSVITGQGVFRVSAWGKDADKHSRGLQRLIDTDGFALLLGVDIYKLTAMHYVEDILPEEIKKRFKASEEARKVYPENQWFIEAWECEVKPWYVIQDRAYEKGFIKEGYIGNCKCMFFNVKSVVELYRQALQHEPFELYGLA